MGILLKFLGCGIRRRRCSPSNNSPKISSLGKLLVTTSDHQDHKEYGEDNIIYRKNGSVVVNFSWNEITRFTMNFSVVIGTGGFSNIYLGHLTNSTLGAIKIHSGTSERLYRAYKQELDILLHLHHHHIVKLLGYYDDQEKGVLVLEYIQNGSLQEKLHKNYDSCDGSNSPFPLVVALSWKKRMQIAFQLAEAIEYLHEKCSPHIVHGDIKSSNILLDHNFDCKLCDFGSAKMGFSSTIFLASRQNQFVMCGSPGYVDPHYLRTGIASKKNDIYSFGVVLLELITGLEACCSETGQMLTSRICGSGGRVDAIQGDVMKQLALEMVDPRLRGQFDLEEARIMASIAGLCLHHSPSLRPSAPDIVFSMKHQIPSSSSSSSSVQLQPQKAL